MLKDIGIIGCFDYKNNHVIGAVVKTREISRILQKNNYSVLNVDTYSWKKRLPTMIFEIIRVFFLCSHIVVISALPSFCKINMLLSMLAKLTKKKYEFVLIGGQVQEACLKRYNSQLKKVNKIIVESKSLQDDLEQFGIVNTSVMYNFKDLIPVGGEKYEIEHGRPLQFCTFSRVTKEKGISDAIAAIKQLNVTKEKIVACLDIYGEVDKKYEEQFFRILSDPAINEYVKYKGIVKSDESVRIISKYFMLVFPTKFEGEGFPGTIIDSLNAGVPILASRWRYYDEILKDGYDSISYEYGNLDKLTEKLFEITDNPDYIMEMKENCLIKAKKFDANQAIKVLTRNWDD